MFEYDVETIANLGSDEGMASYLNRKSINGWDLMFIERGRFIFVRYKNETS